MTSVEELSVELNQEKNDDCFERKRVYRYSVTGSAAHTRLVPLFPADWKDCSPGKQRLSEDKESKPDFVWENAPRKDTKLYRDYLKAYSHLPNGTAILDNKWVLARLFEERQMKDTSKDNSNNAFPHLAALESHCFRGPDGYEAFCEQVFSASDDVPEGRDGRSITFPDLLVDNGACPAELPKEPSSLWVVKDAFSNGAGGIWVVDKASAASLKSTNNSGPLYDDHRYVAQRYAWPPVLYGGRKCHVRAYGLLTADGRAFVHRRAFLHVANDMFYYNGGNSPETTKGAVETESTKASTHFEASVHITNCCANSYDNSKFAGEILADLEATEFAVDEETGQTIVPLAPFFSSMKASLAALTQRSWPYLEGGKGNQGFEYLGMDFILSYRPSPGGDQLHEPVAYLLEINAPPSQDTATGLKHAEDLHDDVIRDILYFWVIPKVTGGEYPGNQGGWRCAHIIPRDECEDSANHILPSKAAIINKIRWALVERKAMKSQDTKQALSHVVNFEQACDDAQRYVTYRQDEEALPPKKNLADLVSSFARSKFPFFQRSVSIACGVTEHSNGEINVNREDLIFWENAGGSQVPIHVIEQTVASLSYRNRSIVGAAAKNVARETFGKLLGADDGDQFIFLGCNATSLLSSLANQYIQSGLLRPGDEIVLSTENHSANVTPWLMAAQMIGAKVRWWAPSRSHVAPCSAAQDHSWSTHLEELVNDKTRIVAVSHASNILGQVRDLESMRKILDTSGAPFAHLVVDGVAACPHVFPRVSHHQVDWYVVSCHKFFGPHMGALYGRKLSVNRLAKASGICDSSTSTEAIYKMLEVGTINYEGASGAIGLGQYFADLSMAPLKHGPSEGDGSVAEACQPPFQSPQEGTSGPQRSEGAQTTRARLTSERVVEAYRRIRLAEVPLVAKLLSVLRKSTKVTIMEIDDAVIPCLERLPVVSFVHEAISSTTIVSICSEQGVACRQGLFLSNTWLPKDLGFDGKEGVVRLSLVHYNTISEVEDVARILESIPGWF
jgi:selenocysteine lyase/cysteine desulfurase